MREKRDLVFVEHILESINAIEDFSKGLSKEKLISSRLRQSAIIREIEIIGEAVKNISKNLKESSPNVSWAEIAGTRDKMIHHYFGVDLEIVWNILKSELPDLKKQLLGIKEDLMKV